VGNSVEYISILVRL